MTNKSSNLRWWSKTVFYVSYGVVMIPVGVIGLLTGLAGRAIRKSRTCESVLHISPKLFNESGTIGGGERYPMELAQAMSPMLKTILIGFGPTRVSTSAGGVEIREYPCFRSKFGPFWMPKSLEFVRDILVHDIVHIHQYKPTSSRFCLWMAAVLGKRVFVSDHGGLPNFREIVPLRWLVDGLLAVSLASVRALPPFRRTEVIFGGPPASFQEVWEMPVAVERTHVLYVGRLLADKGINYLIEAMPADVKLILVGKPYDSDFFEFCKGLAQKKDVEFRTGMADHELIELMRTAYATVLPSVHRCITGKYNPLPELLGLVLLESMACGTPVICTRIGGMPEIVKEGENGCIVEANDCESLRRAIQKLTANPACIPVMGTKARGICRENFTYSIGARKCIALYRSV